MSTLSEVLCYNCYRRQGCKLKDLIEDVNGVIHFTGAISWNTAVLPHGAVIAQTQQLVNCGDCEISNRSGMVHINIATS